MVTGESLRGPEIFLKLDLRLDVVNFLSFTFQEPLLSWCPGGNTFGFLMSISTLVDCITMEA